MIIISKFPSRCRLCGGQIVVGSKVEWTKGEKAAHAACAGVSSEEANEPTKGGERMSGRRGSVAEVARREIRAGKTDAEVLEVLVRECGLDASDPKKRTYPAWYRAELRRAEKLVGKPGTAAPSVSSDDLMRMIEGVVTRSLADAEPPESTVDPDLVKKLIDEAVAKRVKPTVIEVKLPGKKPTKIEGAHFWFERLVKVVATGQPVYLWGPAGSGKTTAAVMAAHALKREYELDTFDPSTVSSRIQGWMNAQGKPVHTSFTRCWEGGKVFIADELDNSPGQVQTNFNPALANGHTPLAWGNVPRVAGFQFIGTGNTPGQPTREFPERRPMSHALKDRLYFIFWPTDRNIMYRSLGMKKVYPAPDRVEETVAPDAWGDYVDRMMDWAAVNAPTLSIGPRAGILGAQMLEAGETPDEVADGLIFRGVDAEIRRKAMNSVRWEVTT